MLRTTTAIAIATAMLATATAHAEPPPATVLFLGDSLTEGYGLPATAAFPARVGELVEARLNRPAVIVNAGVSGSTTASGLDRLVWHLKRDPDVLVLALGANDGLRGVPVDAARANLEAIVDRALAQGIAVVLAGMQLPPNYGSEYTGAFAAMYRQIAAERDVILIPFLLAGVAGDRRYNLPDGIHPNAAGHRIMAETVYAHLEGLLSSSR